MRKRLVRFSLVATGLFVVLAQAPAQTVSFWYNSLGDASANQPSIINVTSGSNVTLSAYVKTTSVGALSGINLLFGYSTTTTVGSSATPADTNATFNSFSWAQSDLNSGQLADTTGGGGGPANGVSRPWGFFASTANLSSTFSGTGDGVNFHILDLTLHINAAAGTNITTNLWSFTNPNTDTFASAVVNGSANEFFPASPYTATLHVVAAPEPASIALLGIGTLALLRRRGTKRS